MYLRQATFPAGVEVLASALTVRHSGLDVCFDRADAAIRLEIVRGVSEAETHRCGLVNSFEVDLGDH